MHSNPHLNMGLEPEYNVSNAQATPQNLASWHLVPTPSSNSHAKSISQKPSLKLKIVRHPVNKQNGSISNWQTTAEQIPGQQDSLVKLNELDDQMSARVEVDSQPIMSRKRTPWYLLPQKPASEGEHPEPAPLVSTFKERNCKHRVANKPNPEHWDSLNKISEELSAKLESCKNKLTKPPKLQYASCDKTNVLPFNRRITHSWDQQDKIPALDISIQDTPSIPLIALRKDQSELAEDFLIAKEARKRAEELFYLKGTHTKYKSEGFKKSISSKRMVKKSVFSPDPPVLETSLDSKHNNSIQGMGTATYFKEARKETGELFDIRSEQQKPTFEDFKIKPCPKSLNIKNITDPSIENSETILSLNFNNRKLVQPMTNIGANGVGERSEQLWDFKGIQRMPNISGFKIPICPKRHAKNPLDNPNTVRSKTGTNPAIDKTVNFEAAKEARKKAEQLVKCGSIKLTAKKTGEDFKQATSAKRPSIFDELLSTENVSFSSLCATVQDTKETWSNCLDHIYASFSKKSFKEPKETANETESHKAKEVNLASTIFVSCKDISKKFLLTFLTKFGTITAIFIKTRDDAFVVFHVPDAARRACALTRGVATLGGITVEVRMAAAEDLTVITRLRDGVEGRNDVLPKTSQPPRRSCAWFEVAAVENQNLDHCDSRELVTYTPYDMF